jgi:hypothetical protein
MTDQATTPDASRQKRRLQEKVQARRVLFRLLRQHARVARVEVKYDGRDDESCIESIVYQGRSGKPLPRLNDRKLDQAVLDYVQLVLPYGWEDNCGGCGTVAIDAVRHSVHVIHQWRVIAYQPIEFDDR